jgi:hypothetical protein
VNFGRTGILSCARRVVIGRAKMVRSEVNLTSPI